MSNIKIFRLDTYKLHWFQNEMIVNLRECADSLFRNYVPGFTFLALNPSFYFGEQPETIQTIMMITWKAQWELNMLRHAAQFIILSGYAASKQSQLILNWVPTPHPVAS